MHGRGGVSQRSLSAWFDSLCTMVVPTEQCANQVLCLQDWDCGSPYEQKAFPCGWEGAVMTPREPFSTAFQQQPQPAAVSRMAMNMHKYWKVFFQDELGPLPDLVYAQVAFIAMQTPSAFHNTEIHGQLHFYH